MFSIPLFPEGDKGGNSILTQQGFSLHALWDEFVGDWTTFASARDRAREFLGNQQIVEGINGLAANLDEKAWLGESRELRKRPSTLPKFLPICASMLAVPMPDHSHL